MMLKITTAKWNNTWFLQSLLLCIALFVTKSCSKVAEHDFVVAAYLPEYRFYININATAPLLTDLILFSVEANKFGLVSNVCCLDSSHYQKAREARAYKRETTGEHLNLWLSVGGAGRSNGFPQLAGDSKKRSRYLESLKTLCIKEELDGVDFDWEQPSSQQEYEAYMMLLMEAVQLFHDSNNLMMVSVATRQLIIPLEVAQSLDRIHLMAYNLAFREYHASYSIVTRFVEQWQNHPPNKLVLGIPAYAQHLQTGQMDKTFSEIMDQVLSKQDAAPDEIENEFQGYRFDSPKTVQRKVAYAISKQLKGVFLWELGQDKQLEGVAPGGVLLEAAVKQYQQSIESNSRSNKQEL